MPILELTSRERSDLRSAAHSLKPVVLIGDKGLSDAVLKEIDLALTTHGLIKVRAGGEDRETREALLADICEALSCAPVHHLGKLFILYRPSAHKPAPTARPEQAAKPVKRKASEPHTPKKMAAEGKKLARTPRRKAAEPEAQEPPRAMQQAGKPPRPGTRKTASTSASHGVPRRSGSALSLRAGTRRGPSAGQKTVRAFKKS
ncbi:YhbY family RNA-binding protein [Bordetella sp. FB-8]|uniref:YhbY family RNA-binding protein n=1 Tax=Bordetella sp. FB-8 TaxID=1159870 RepID=UPI00035C36B7|nr:YhbY family RNA-binding protein [Bordetella sp. FB-8]